MRDLLVPIFGAWGAVVAQFLLTIVIVLGLIGAVWWFMRRYSGVHFGGIGRGRVPRLAVIDAIPVDRRRRLVLVRRDNVEHLLLIGGPSDVVVEGTIQRVRPRSAQAAAQAAAARAAMQPAIDGPAASQPETAPPEAAGAGERPANQPIPFPAGRSALAQAASANGRSQPRPVRQPPVPPEAAAAPSASFIEPQPATRLSPMHGRAAAAPPAAEAEPHEPEELAADVLLPEVMTAEAAPLSSWPPAPPAAPLPATFAEADWEAAEEARQSTFDLGDADLATAAAGEDEFPADTAGQPQAAPAAARGQDGTMPADPAVRVSDLEREMARLLDEITTRRSS